MVKMKQGILPRLLLILTWCYGYLSTSSLGFRGQGTDVTRFGTARHMSDEEKLMGLLFDNYNPSARPVMNSSRTVHVEIQMSLLHIKDLDVRSQLLTTTGLLILEWRDERLTWNPTNHNNMTEIVVEAKKLWKPEFAVINGAEKIYEVYDQFRAVISNEGLVHWEPGGAFKTMCEIDITYYPFDEQICDLTFGAWSYHTSKMNLSNMEDTVNLDSYKENGEFKIVYTTARRNVFSYDCCPNEKFSNVKFKLYLRRRHTFYILNVILPSVMMSVLLLSVFFCTPGQKVQIGVAVLLSFRIFLLNVAGNIPRTSDHIPLLGIYLTCTMAITTLSMVLTVFVLNLHHMTDKPVPPWAKTLVIVYIGKLMGMCPTSDEKKRDRMKRIRSSAYLTHPVNNADTDIDDSVTIIELRNRASITQANQTTPLESALHRGPQKARDPEPEATTDYSSDWKHMAETCDRLFFWLFLFATLISTLLLFHPLTRSGLSVPETELN